MSRDADAQIAAAWTVRHEGPCASQGTTATMFHRRSCSVTPFRHAAVSDGTVGQFESSRVVCTPFLLLVQHKQRAARMNAASGLLGDSSHARTKRNGRFAWSLWLLVIATS